MKRAITPEEIIDKYDELVDISDEISDELKLIAKSMLALTARTEKALQHTALCPAKDGNALRFACNSIEVKAANMYLMDALLNEVAPSAPLFKSAKTKMKFLHDCADIFIEGIAQVLYE